MGNTSSKPKGQGQGYSAQFYAGCTAAQGGAYTISEIYFNQAITKHPGHDFWTRLMETVVVKTEKSSSPAAAAAVARATSAATAHRRPSPDSLTTVRPMREVVGTTAFSDGDAMKNDECGVAQSRQASPPPPDANLSVNEPVPPQEEEEEEEEELDSRPTIVLPVDHRLVDVQDYVRMLTDIGRIYRRKAADSTGDSREMSCRLSMLYNAYTAVRLEALLTVFRLHFAEQNTEGDPRAEDKFQIYLQRAMNAQWGSAVFKSEMNQVRSVVDDSAIDMSSRVSSEKDGQVDRAHDENLCLLWQTMEYLRNTNVLSYAVSALRLVRVSEYAMSAATKNAVLEMVLRCFEVVEQDLAQTAEANSYMYFGAHLKRFLDILKRSREECQSQLVQSPAGPPLRSGVKHAQLIVKELVPKFLRLGPVNLAERQTTFLRTAMYFPVTTLPMLDTAKILPVVLDLQHNGNRHRRVKLMTPLDRSYGWYMIFAKNDNYERHSEKPGQSAFLLQRCAQLPGSTLKDPNFFTCVGLEEFCVGILPIVLGIASILNAQGKAMSAEHLGRASHAFVVDTYGGASPLSDLVQAMMKQLGGEITE